MTRTWTRTSTATALAVALALLGGCLPSDPKTSAQEPAHEIVLGQIEQRSRSPASTGEHARQESLRQSRELFLECLGGAVIRTGIFEWSAWW